MPDDDDRIARSAVASAPTVADATAAAATLNDGLAAAATEAAGTRGEYLPFELPPPGYQLGSMLGRGGMGEVVIAQDQRVGREVAYKRMRDPNAGPEALGRFLREARIQARLDHPAIVPVYELGKDTEGRPYFTMKRVTGKTLAEHLTDPVTPRQRLLRAFAEVCLAVELAHSRGVVHRDLKPQNIMLGDFGEVYVLDWGIARIVDEQGRDPSHGAADRGDIDSIGEATSDGTMLGTLGYMSPEQMRGELVGPATDVYALGSILFELLAGVPLHPRGNPAVASTLSLETAAPSERVPEREIPPELDSICRDSLQADARARPTARELAERVQRYLDGDRDLEQRRTLARQHVAGARAALASGDANRRADALREASRALALDNRSSEAAAIVTTIMLEPPAQQPADLVATLERSETELARGRAKKAISSYLLLMALGIVLLFYEVKSVPWLLGIYGIMGAFIAISVSTYRTGRIHTALILPGTLIAAIMFSRIASPYILVPSVMCGTLLAICNIPALNDRPWVLYAWMACIAMIPTVLEWAGALPATTSTVGGHVVIMSSILEVHAGGKLGGLFLANAVFLLVVTRFAVSLARDRRVAHRAVTVQAWHLNHLLPDEAQVTTPSTTPPV